MVYVFIFVMCIFIDYFSFFILCYYILFFFFKQKTAYVMRFIDWSSDVCSSDLAIYLSSFSKSPSNGRDAETVWSRSAIWISYVIFCPAEARWRLPTFPGCFSS